MKSKSAIERKAYLLKLRELERHVSHQSLSESEIHEAEGLRDVLREKLSYKGDRKRLDRAQQNLTNLIQNHYFPETTDRDDEQADTSTSTATAPSIFISPQQGTENSSAVVHTDIEPAHATETADSKSDADTGPENIAEDEDRAQATCRMIWWHPNMKRSLESVRWKHFVSKLYLRVICADGLKPSVKYLEVYADSEKLTEESYPLEPQKFVDGQGMVALDLLPPRKRLVSTKNDFRKVSARAKIKIAGSDVEVRCELSVSWRTFLWCRKAAITFPNDEAQEALA